MENIKIITINTWKCDGDYSARLPILAAQLKTLQPSVVSCQECFKSDEIGADTLQYLSAELNMNYSFLPGRFKKRQVNGSWVDSFSGLGILSVYPLTASGNFDLPDVPGDDDRKVQQVIVTLPSEKKLMLTNTHLTHISDTLQSRKKQAEALADIVLKNNDFDYHVICGDFNAMPGSVAIKAFTDKTNAVDCYVAGNGPEPRCSMLDAFQAGQMICVDQVFAMPIADEKLDFVDSAIVLNMPDQETGLYPSDHFCIATTLLIS